MKRSMLLTTLKVFLVDYPHLTVTLPACLFTYTSTINYYIQYLYVNYAVVAASLMTASAFTRVSSSDGKADSSLVDACGWIYSIR